MSPGHWNGITDVPGVRVGHVTLQIGDAIRTGATAVLPHDQNPYLNKCTAGLAVANGFGKLIGSTQLQETGELESPIVLTNTLAVPRAADAILDWILDQPGMEDVISVNPIAGETNDGYLNDIRRRILTADQIRMVLDSAVSGPVLEGAIGAGTGTVCLGWKGGIGSSSRLVKIGPETYTVGVLVQSNFGGRLQIMGRLVRPAGAAEPPPEAGSIMIVAATDAPLSSRNLSRLAFRSFAGVARTGADFSHGSGDYAIAFSTTRRGQAKLLSNEQISPFFLAISEATEEAIYNSLFLAKTTTGYKGRTVHSLPNELIPRGEAA